MAHPAILKRIRLLIPAKLDGHYEAVCRAFEEEDLTAPHLSISDIQLARAISEFTGACPRDWSIAAHWSGSVGNSSHDNLRPVILAEGGRAMQMVPAYRPGPLFFTLTTTQTSANETSPQ
jgi:hypothetical protein